MADTEKPSGIEAGQRALWACAALYGLYALFLLGEVLDLLSMLHSKPPGESPTYDIVNVAYYIVDMVVCIAVALALLGLRLTRRSKWAVVMACLAVAFGRAGLVYYLYEYTTPEYRWVPYIYKKANELSGPVRAIMLPGQVILGLVSAWYCARVAPPATPPGSA